MLPHALKHVYVYVCMHLQAYDTLKEFSKENFGLTLEAKELSLKGWNWGKAEVQSHQLEFVVQGRTMFELPFNEISSTAVSAKNEVTVEMALNDNSAQNKKIDSLVDIRFYIPPSAEMAEDDEQEDAMDAATVSKPLTHLLVLLTGMYSRFLLDIL